jgi:hypothetical protein
VTPPPPGLSSLARRVGHFDQFVAELVRSAEGVTGPGGVPLGRDWDVEGDPRAMQLARLWAFVAEGVAAYAELTAGEAYLPTARDWTDLRRITALVGHRPRPRVAAQGWVRVDTDRGAAPLVPAGTRVQAPAVPGVREAQTFETIADSQLRADWADLTATPVPTPSAPTGRTLRFLADPGFAPGDRVLFVRERKPAATPPPILGWAQFWTWLTLLVAAPPSSDNEPVALAEVIERAGDLGTTVVSFDRDLSDLLKDADKAYAAYRVTEAAGSARRLSKVLKLGDATPTAQVLSASLYSTQSPVSATAVVLDTELETPSREQRVIVTDWRNRACDLAVVSTHQPLEWEVAPGTPTRVTKLDFTAAVPTLQGAGTNPVSVYVVDRRVAARHYRIDPADRPAQLRVFPAPAEPPRRIAVRSVPAGAPPVWEVFACAPAAVQETAPADPRAPRGLVLDLLEGTPAGTVDRAPASANLVRVRHGATAAKPLGGGDATAAGLSLPVPAAPVAADLGPDGTPVSSLVVRVDGLRWEELPSLFGAGPTDVYTTVLAADGGVTVRFGDGEQGNRPATGRDNVTGTWRVGGGLASEVPSGAIDSLVGSIRGVKSVEGVGPTAGGADQDDERRARQIAPGRARAFGRAVSLADLRDLALGYPGVSHAVVWTGAGPPGCPCGTAGLHLGFLRRASASVRAPLPDEVTSLAAFLDARRDAEVALCVAAAVVTPVLVTATVDTDPRSEQAAVLAAVRAALLDPEGPAGPLTRKLGQPLDRSDLLAVIHGVAAVVGVASLTLGGIQAATAALGRVPARVFELLVVAPGAIVTGVAR